MSKIKPEPLKGKQIDVFEADELDYENRPEILYEHTDIKSAVEWYKKYRNNWRLFEKDYPTEYKTYLSIPFPIEFDIWLLDKAFEDVMKSDE